MTTSSVRLSSYRSWVRTNQIACIMQLIVEHGIVACSKLMNFFFLICSSPRGELTTGNVTKISVLSSLQVPYLFTASPLRDSTQGIFFFGHFCDGQFNWSFNVFTAPCYSGKKWMCEQKKLAETKVGLHTLRNYVSWRVRVTSRSLWTGSHF